MCTRLFSWRVRMMSVAGCDTTTSDMLVFVCSAVCSNSQFGRKPTLIPFLKLKLAGGWETLLFAHRIHRWIPVHLSPWSEVTLSLNRRGQKVQQINHYSPQTILWDYHTYYITLKLTFFVPFHEMHILKDSLYPQDEHLHRPRHLFKGTLCRILVKKTVHRLT